MREDISFEKYLRAKNVIIKKTNTNMNIIMLLFFKINTS